MWYNCELLCRKWLHTHMHKHTGGDRGINTFASKWNIVPSKKFLRCRMQMKPWQRWRCGSWGAQHAATLTQTNSQREQSWLRCQRHWERIQPPGPPRRDAHCQPPATWCCSCLQRTGNACSPGDLRKERRGEKDWLLMNGTFCNSLAAYARYLSTHT